MRPLSPRLSAELAHQNGAFSGPGSEFSPGLRKIPRPGLLLQPSLNGDRTLDCERERRHGGARTLHSPSYRPRVGHGPFAAPPPHRLPLRPDPRATPQRSARWDSRSRGPGAPRRHSAPCGREERAAHAGALQVPEGSQRILVLSKGLQGRKIKTN